MANTTLTHQLVADHAAMILEEEAPFSAGINSDLEDEFRQVRDYKPGQSVTIKVPPNGVVHEGAVFAGGSAAPDNTETSVQLTLLPQKHIALTFTMREMALEVSEFRERILRPQMRTLASWIEADLLKRGVAMVPNIVGTPGTVPTAMKTYAQAREKMQMFLAPPSDRRVVFSSAANTELVDASRQLFHAGPQIQKGFLEGYLGRAQGADFFEHQSIPTHTNGTATAFTVSGAGQTGTSLNIGGLTAAQTITKGTIFTLPTVVAVHPLTGAAYGSTLQQFVVTADFTAAGTTGTISIFPAIQPDATKQNRTVSNSPANSASATIIAGGKRNLMFQKAAFAAAFVGLPVPQGLVGATSRALPNGFRTRVYSFPDGTNDRESTRLDVMYGIAAPRPLHACIVAE